MHEEQPFTGAQTLRIYDSVLCDDLAESYRKNKSNYESKNHFLCELIEKGLSQKRYEQDVFEAAYAKDEAVTEKLAELTKIINSLSGALYALYSYLSNIQKLSCATYHLAEVQNAYYNGISQTELDGGMHDGLPRRFMQKKLGELSETLSDA